VPITSAVFNPTALILPASAAGFFNTIGHGPALLLVALKVRSGSDCGHSYGSTAVIGHTSDFTPAARSPH
jgi:hypothetical protein